MCELCQLGVVANQHSALHCIAKLAQHIEQLARLDRIQPIIHQDILALVIELLGYDLRRLERTRRRLDRIKSGATWRFANRLPIFGASRLPRSFNGRSLSANAGSSRLDLAWRMRNSVFMRLPKAMRSQSYRHQTFQRMLPEPGTPGTNVPRVVPVEALLRHPEKD